MSDDNYNYDEEDKIESGDNSLGAIRALAQEQKEAEAEVARCETALQKAKDNLRTISEQKLPELMDELGIPEFKTADGLKVTIKETIRASMGRSEDEKERALNWLDEHGHGALIKRTIEVPFARGKDEEARKLRDNLRGEGLRATFQRKVESSTLRSFVSEQLESGEDIPLDIFKVVRDRKSKVDI